MLAELTHSPDCKGIPGTCDACHEWSTCGRCGGSGGGPDPALKCIHCNGTGLDPRFNPEEVQDWWEPSDLLDFVGGR